MCLQVNFDEMTFNKKFFNELCRYENDDAALRTLSHNHTITRGYQLDKERQ